MFIWSIERCHTLYTNGMQQMANTWDIEKHDFKPHVGYVQKLV